jgi:hypothetical protein
MRYRYWATGTGIIAALSLGIAQGTAQQTLQVRTDRWLELKEVVGDVTREQNGLSFKAKVGDRLTQPGDAISTGKQSSVKLIIDLGIGTIFVSENTKLRISSLDFAPDNGRITLLQVTGGQVRLQIRHFNHDGSRLEIRSPAGVSGVRGTEFGMTVQPGGKTGLAVGRGRVVSAAQNRSVAVSQGFQNYTIPGKPPSSPVPLRNDTRLKYQFQSHIQGGVRGIRLIGQVDPVNNVVVDKRPQSTDRNGRFVTDLLPLPNSLKFNVVVTTPLGKQQTYDLEYR